jgi:hypothetical protein
VSDTGGGAPMSREGVDHALARLRDERDRISAALLDLDNQHGYQLLEGAELTGETKRRWDETRARIATLWRLFDAYVRVLEDAEDLRRRNPRPEAVMTELTWLLGGRSLELTGEEIPLERRTLLGPATERLSLDEAVAGMTAAYDEAVEMIATADAAWAALLPKLAQAEEMCQALEALARDLAIPQRSASTTEEGDAGQAFDPDIGRAAKRLDQIRQAIRTDPLSLVDADGRLATGAPDAILASLTELKESMEATARLREDYPERIRGVQAVAGQIAEIVAESRRTREIVSVKVLTSDLPEVSDPVPALRDRLAEVDLAWRRGRRAEAGRRLARLEADCAHTLERARAALSALGGLLDRRGELRGRLEAYAAKAARLGYAEDAELERLHREARDLLWVAPCDLEQATVVLARYQRALNSLATRTDK